MKKHILVLGNKLTFEEIKSRVGQNVYIAGLTGPYILHDVVVVKNNNLKDFTVYVKKPLSDQCLKFSSYETYFIDTVEEKDEPVKDTPRQRKVHELFFLVLLVLKLSDKIDWSWWWILSPLWIPVAVSIAYLISAYVFDLANIINQNSKLKDN